MRALLLAAAATALAPTRRSAPARATDVDLRSAPARAADVDRRAAIGGLVAAGLLPRIAVAAGAPPNGKVASQEELLAAAGSVAKKKIIVTGANSGVGLEGAKLLAAAGHDVVCACRNQAKAEAAAAACGGGATPGVCDLADLGSVRTFAKTVKGVDALVLNAGLALNTKDAAPTRTADGFELTIGTNHLGHFLLYNLLEKTLASAGGAPRLVVTASPVHDPLSGGGKVGSTATLGDLSGLAAGPRFDMVDGGAFDADKAYKDSKLCNILFTAEASRRLAKLNPKATAHAFSPGLIPSPDGFFRYQPKFFAKTFSAISTKLGVAETAAFGGACLSYAATSPDLDAFTNGWLDTEPPGKHQLLCHEPSAEARDVAEQKRLWALSEKLVGLA